ncbi:MAG: hypothetical protein OEM52_01985 [bacterium]|nr:hypothetical protein [bacterium]
MKGKVLAVLAVTLLASFAFALESGPSNPVGFFTTVVSHTPGIAGYNLVSFPTIPTDASLANTLSNQVPGGAFAGAATQIMWFNNATGTFSTAWKTLSGSTWNTAGGIATLDPKKGYYIVLRAGAANASYNVVVAGNVQTGPSYDMGTMGVGYNMIGSVWAAPQALTASNLWTADLQRFRGGTFSGNSDQIRSFTGSAFLTVWMNNSNVWQTSGAFSSFDPGKGFYVIRRAGRTPATFAWPDYPVPASAADNMTTSIGSNPSVTAPVSIVPTSNDVAPVIKSKKATTAK